MTDEQKRKRKAHEATRLSSYIAVEMKRIGGRDYRLSGEDLSVLGIHKLRVLKAFVDDARSELGRAKRTVRTFPGGPKIRF